MFSVALSLTGITGHRVLPGTLPCGARTFLPRFRESDRPARSEYFYNALQLII